MTLIFMDKELKEIFDKRYFKGEVRLDQPMSFYTSLRIGGPVKALAFPEDVESLRNIIIESREENIPLFVLGAGTNLLVRDGGVDGIAVCLKAFKKIDLIQNMNNTPEPAFDTGDAGLFVESGVLLNALINFARKSGYSGIEALAGIPGTFGGAVFMNAGSFGSEIRDIIISVTVMNMDGSIQILKKDELNFSYRSSNIPGDVIILSADITLKKDTGESISKRINDYLERRKSSQPIGTPSAGCVFKNPDGAFAGRLIEEAGCKGMRNGDVEVSSLHANYFINKGGATSRDFIELMESVRAKVKASSGITLEPEIKIIGKDG
ncbi:MAG: UDP-N-acetylmuramate dehydrogenase [Nitrospirae bacterium]|nr:UDP-N-acetylmuramate dehydrogenase [Nitrospirota bacterium]